MTGILSRAYMKLNNEELNIIRQVKIQRILGLQNNGRRLSIKCPFHNERTASLTLYPDGSYYCYGCKAHGNNSIDFMIGLGYTFPNAVQEVSKYL